MFKKFSLIFFMFIVILLISSKKSDIAQVFNQLEDKTIEQYMQYHISYDNSNLTTSNILGELSFLEYEKNIKIVIITEVADEMIQYNINSSNLKKELGEFFNYCVSKLESKFLDNEVVKAYSSGIKINKLIITMPSVLANNYIQNKTDIKYEIKTDNYLN